MAKGLSGIGFGALKSDIHFGLTPDQGKRVRYNAISIAAPTERVPPRLLEILCGAPETRGHHAVPSRAPAGRRISIGDVV